MYYKGQNVPHMDLQHEIHARRHWVRGALYTFLVLYPVIEGISNQIFPVGNSIIVFTLVILWSIDILKDKKIFLTRSLVILFLLAFWSLASYFWSTDQVKTIFRITSLLPIVFIYMIIIDLTSSVDDLRKLLYSYCAGVSLLGATAVYNIMKGITYEGLYNRFSAIGYDPNNFGIFIMSSVPIFMYLVRTKKSDKSWYSWVYYVFCLSLALSTGSRGAIISGLIVSIYMLVIGTNMMSGTKLAIKNIMLAFASTYGLYVLLRYFIPPEAINRFFEQIGLSTSDSRASIWQESYLLWSNHWLLGIGANATSSNTISETQTHNTFISYFTELGIIGGVLWLTAWVLHIIYAIRIYKFQSYLSISLVTSSMCILIGALTLNWESRKPLYIIWSISVAALSIYKKGRS